MGNKQACQRSSSSKRTDTPSSFTASVSTGREGPSSSPSMMSKPCNQASHEAPISLQNSEPCNGPPPPPLHNSDTCNGAPPVIRTDEDTRIMDPDKIRYSQTRFHRSFTPSPLKKSAVADPDVAASYKQALKAAPEPDLLLHSLLSKLKEKHISVHSIAPIRVFLYNDHWYSLDNRRLWVFKQYGKPIPVKVTTSLYDFLRIFRQDGDNQCATFLPDSNLNHSIGARMDIQRQDLLDHVFHWSIDDIMDDNMLKCKVKTIPEKFTSLNQYFASFEWPLVEEVRAQLKESLEDIEEAPYVPLVDICESQIPQSSKGAKKFKEFEVLIDQEHLNGITGKDGTPSKFRPKDLLLLSPTRPGSIEEVRRFKHQNLMAFVTEIREEDVEEMQRDKSEPSYT